MDEPEIRDVTDRNDPLLRKAEEFFDLPLRYEEGVGWVDRNGQKIKTRKWSEIRRHR